MRISMLVLLLAALLATACGGAFAVNPAATADGLLRAVMNGPGTFMMASNELVMVAWPQGQAYGFAVFTQSGNAISEFAELAGCTANKTGCTSMAHLVRFLRDNGWQRIYALPAATVTQIKSLARYFGVAGSTASTFSLFVLPYTPDFDIIDLLNPSVDA